MQKNHWRNSAPIQLTENALMEENMTKISFNPCLHHSQKLTRKAVCMDLHAQLCPTLCDPMDCSLPGLSAHGIFQARILERVAISCFRGTS